MSIADEPAFPVVPEIGEEGGLATYMGLTKGEYFAAHAPEMPNWYWYSTQEYKSLSNQREPSGEDRLKFQGVASMRWRAYYANNLASELERAS